MTLKKLSKIYLPWIFWLCVFVAAYYWDKQSENPESSQIVNVAPTESQAKESIRICTWNLHNFSIADRYVEGKWNKEYPKPLSERQTMAKIFAEINPDIILAQELGANHIEVFVKDLETVNLFYPYRKLLNAGDTERCIAIFSKLPFDKIFEYAHLPFDYYDEQHHTLRGLLGVLVNNNAYIYTAHLKSRKVVKEFKSDKENLLYRTKEVESFLPIFAKHKDDIFVFAADFNDEPNSTIFAKFKDFDFEVLEQYDSERNAWTYSWKKHTEFFQYDFFWISKNAKEKIANPARVFDNTHKASDHRPVYFDLKLN